MAPTTIASALYALSSGVRFHPTAEEAVLFYLHRCVLGQPVDMAAAIHHAHVYSYEPRELAAAFPRLPSTDDRFFFTTCRRQKAGRGYRMLRVAGNGHWVSQAKKPVQNWAGEPIGYCDKLRFTYNKGGGESDWLMEEYHCFLPEAVAAGGTEERVFCRIYVSPRSPPGSVTRQEYAAGDVHLPKESAASSAPAVQQPPQQPLPPVAVPAVIAQPLALQMPAPPCPVVQSGRVAAATSSGTRQRRVMATPVPAPVTTTQPQVQPPCPKRMHGAAVLPTRKLIESTMEVEDEALDKDIDMEEFARSLEDQLDTAEEEGQQEQPAADQGEDDMGKHASSLDGLVFDEREDEVVAQEVFDVLKNISDSEDDDDCLSFPLSYYNDKLF